MIAVLGPGGVGGLIAGALDRAGLPVTIVAREETAATLRARGLNVSSVTLGEWHSTPPVTDRLERDVEALIVATKANGLDAGLARIGGEPGLVLPLLNGLDHLPRLRERYGPRAVAASIRVESDRRETGVIVHSSRFLRIEMASEDQHAPRAEMAALAAKLTGAGVETAVLDSEPGVLWGKLVRLNALACTTSASGLLLGAIREDPLWRSRLERTVHEGAAVAAAEGADVSPQRVLGELQDAHATLGSSMARDLAAGRASELDAIPGAVLRAASRHGIACPAIEELVELITARWGL